MNDTCATSLMLIGVGGAGVTIARNIRRAYGSGLSALALDTDASSGSAGDIDFFLLGGNRLAGRGAGGKAGAVRAAFQDDPALLDAKLAKVRTAVIVTALGGGTGNGATLELVKRLGTLGVTSLVFATLPFAFEGEERRREAQAALSPLTSQADALVTLPLDDLVGEVKTDNFQNALLQATDLVASGVTLLWRLLEKPGYIRLDAERLNNLLAGSGAARFTAVSAAGENRAGIVLERLRQSALLAATPSARPVRRILLGVLAGDDLRLSEIATLADGTRAAFGPDAAFALGTVNDEATFSGRLAAVVLLFEENATHRGKVTPEGRALRRRNLSDGEKALSATDRFGGVEKTLWNDEDLDIPTYLRRNLTLER